MSHHSASCLQHLLLWLCWGVSVGVGVAVGLGVGVSVGEGVCGLKVFRQAKLSDLCREMSDNEWRARAFNKQQISYL
jgi:hypothetical protein